MFQHQFRHSRRLIVRCSSVFRAPQTRALAAQAAKFGSPSALSARVRGLPPSATLAINERSNELIANGRDVIKFGLGQSPFPVAPSVVRSLQQNAHQKDYLPVKGLPLLRNQIAEHLNRRFGSCYSAEDLIVGPGSKELLFLIQVAYDGDLVLPNPSWVSYAPQARIAGREVHWVETSFESHWKMRAADLDDLCRATGERPRILVLNYPSNPTGQTYSAEELKEIGDVARAHSMIVVSDEIYGEVDFDGNHSSIAATYPEGTVVSSGLSKWCGAGGWRLGFFAIPPAFRSVLDAMGSVASESFTAVSAPIQHAAVDAFIDNVELETYLTAERRILRAVGNYTAERLNKAGVRTHAAKGGFYVFPDFSAKADVLRARGVETSEKLVETILEETNVAFLPGSAFGRPSTELTARIAFVDFDGEAALAAVDPNTANTDPLPESFAREFAPRCVEGANRVGEWFERLA